MAEKKRRFTACKERGSPGKREKIVLNANHRRLVKELDPHELVDPLIEVGILDTDEVEEVLKAEGRRAVTWIMTFVKGSGRDAFDKFMAALRMADYNELAADLEVELENTDSPVAEGRTDIEDTDDRLQLVKSSAAGTDVLTNVVGDLAQAGVGLLASLALQKAGFGSQMSTGGIGIHYGKTWGNGNVFHCSASLTPENMFQLCRSFNR